MEQKYNETKMESKFWVNLANEMTKNNEDRDVDCNMIYETWNISANSQTATPLKAREKKATMTSTARFIIWKF